MDAHQLTRRRLTKLYAESHEKAMEYIEIVTDAAFNQMKIEGVVMDPSNIDIKLISQMAAKNLNADFNDIYHDYTDLMVFEGMIAIENPNI